LLGAALPAIVDRRMYMTRDGERNEGAPRISVVEDYVKAHTVLPPIKSGMQFGPEKTIRNI